MRRLLVITLVVFAVSSPVLSSPRFRRGDTDTNGSLDISDAIALLKGLFREQTALTCEDAADVDDSGSLEITDAVYVLRLLFSQGPDLRSPAFPDCGCDPTTDSLDCEAYSGGCEGMCEPRSDATPIRFGESRNGTINPVSEIDVYRFTARAGDEIRIPWHGTAAWAFRLRLELYDETGDLVASSSTGTDNGVLSASVVAGGDYFIWVRESNNSADRTGSYSFTLQRTVDPGNVLATLDFGESRNGTINPVSEIDVYRFTARAGDEIRIPWQGTAAWAFRLRLELYDETGDLVATSYTGTARGVLSASIVAGGDYFIWVRESNNSADRTGSYSFTLNLQ